jgi:hypothetical protein
MVAPLAGADIATVGPVVSRTVTVNEAAPVLPRASVAVQVTVVVPSGNVNPLAGVQVTSTTPSTVSVADAVQVNAAPDGLVASTVAFPGTVTTGGVVSLTVTVNEAVPVLPRTSVAVHVTVVAPSGNVTPLGGVQFTVTPPSMMSVADAA